MCRWCKVVLFDGFNGLSLNDPSVSVFHLNQQIITTLIFSFYSQAHFELSRLFLFIFFPAFQFIYTKSGSLVTVVNGGHQFCRTKWMSVFFCAVFLPLTAALRAVEVFIRDKYERKRYYNEALATAHVSII